MEKSIYKNDFVEVLFDDSKNLIIDKWNEMSEELFINDFKNLKDSLTTWGNLLLENKAQYVLSDTSKFSAPLPPNIQDWIAQNIVSNFIKQPGVYKRHAFLAPEEMIAALGMEQMVEESNTQNKMDKMRYFSDRQEAEDWLYA